MRETRPVEVNIIADYKPWVERGYSKGIYQAKFHGFMQEGNIEDGIDCVAILEMGNGFVITVGANHINFIERG